MTVNLELSQSKSQIQNYASYLELKVGNIFTSWKKNYYICIEDMALIYTENKESKDVLGHIPISNITNLSSLIIQHFNLIQMIKHIFFEYQNPERKKNG